MADRIAHGVVEIEVNDRETLARLNAIRSEFDAAMKDIDRMHADAEIGADLSELRDDLANAKRMVREFEGAHATAELDADKKRLEKDIAEAKALVKTLDGQVATVEMKVKGQENVIKAQRQAEDAARKRAQAEEKMQRDLDALADRTYRKNIQRINQEAKVRESLERQRVRELTAAEREAHRMNRARTVGAAQEVKEIFRLQGEYAKLTNRIERINKKRPIGREARAKVELEAASAYAEMEAVKAKLNFLGGHPPVDIKVDIDRSAGRRIGDFLAKLGNKASGLSDLTVRLGPFTTSIKGLARALSFFGPIISDLLGGASALVGVLGAGISGAATLAAGALSGAALGGLGLVFSLRNTKQEITNARTAINAYQKALQKYGADSDKTKTKQQEMNKTLANISPLAREVAKGIERFYTNWDRHTGQTRKNLGTIAHDGFSALDAITPMWARRTNQLSGMLKEGFHGAFNFIKSETGKGLLDGIMGDFNRQVPTMLHSLGSLGHAFLNFAREGARNLGVFTGGVDDMATKLLRFTQRDDFGATVKRWVNYARDLMRFFGAAGRVLMHFFGASSKAGDRFVNDMTRGLNKWDEFLTSAEGRNTIAEKMDQAVTGVENLWAAIAPIAGAFLEWSANLSPFVSGILKGVSFVGKLVNNITRLVGLTGPLGTLGTTFGAIWAVGKIGAFVSMLARAVALVKELGALGTLKSLATGKFFGQLRVAGSIAEGGATAAAEMRAGIVQGGAAAAAELRGAMAGGGALGAAENLAARGTGAAAAGAGAAAGARGVGTLTAALRNLAPLLGGMAAAAGAAGLAAVLFGGRSRTAADDVHDLNEATSKLHENIGSAVHVLGGAYSQLADGTLSVRDAHNQVAEAQKRVDALTKAGKTGTKEYTQALQGLNSALAYRTQSEKQVRVANTAADKALSHLSATTREHKAANEAWIAANNKLTPSMKSLIELTGNVRKVTGKTVKELTTNDLLKYGDKIDVVAGKEGEWKKSLKELRTAHDNLIRGENNHAAAVTAYANAQVNAQRALKGFQPLATAARQEMDRLVQSLGRGKAIKIASMFPDPRAAERVMAALNKAIAGGTPKSRAFNVVVNAKTAEDALRRLNAIRITPKRLEVIDHGGKDAIAMIERLSGKKVPQKDVKVVEKGGAGALRVLARLIGVKLPPKTQHTREQGSAAVIGKLMQVLGIKIPNKLFRVIVQDAASARLASINASLAAIHDKTITVSIRQSVSRLANYPHASGLATGGQRHMGLVGEGAAPEWGWNRKTGRVSRYDRPTFVPLGRDDAIMPTEARYRNRGREIFKQMAKELGIPAFRASKKPPKRTTKKPPKRTTTNRVIHKDGNKLNLTDFGKARARHEAHKFIQRKTQKNLSKLPEVTRVRQLEQERDDQQRLIGQAENRLKEPATFIKVVGKDVEGNEVYGVDQAQVDNWKTQLEGVQNMWTQMMQILTDLSNAIKAAIPAVQHAIATAVSNINTLRGLERGAQHVIDAKHSTVSEKQAARVQLSEYQKEEARQEKIRDNGRSDLSDLREAWHDNPFDYIDARDQYDHYQDLIDAVLITAQADAASATPELPPLPTASELAIAKAESLGDVPGQIAGYQQQIQEAQAKLSDNNPYNDVEAYNAITSAKNAIAGLQDSAGGGGGSGGSTDSTTPFAQQLMNLNTAREDLYKGFGSNFGLASSFSVPGYGTGAYGSNPAAAGGGGTVNNITNNYAAPPPDPHTWSQGLAWELQATS